MGPVLIGANARIRTGPIGATERGTREK